MRDLGVTLKLTVDIQVKCGVNALKVDIILLIELFLQIEGAAIMPAGIFIRKVREHDRERISDVQILDVVISVHLYTSGNGNSVLQLFVDLEVLNVVELLDLPYAVERHETRA